MGYLSSEIFIIIIIAHWEEGRQRELLECPSRGLPTEIIRVHEAPLPPRDPEPPGSQERPELGAQDGTGKLGSHRRRVGRGDPQGTFRAPLGRGRLGGARRAAAGTGRRGVPPGGRGAGPLWPG